MFLLIRRNKLYIIHSNYLFMTTIMLEDKMTQEQKWKELESKALKEVHKAQSHQYLVKKINKNCRDMKSDERYAHLLDLNARGTHLSDSVFQKLDRNYCKRDPMRAMNSYINDALVRIGNRTMTPEEYEILESVTDDKLVNWDLDEKLRDLQKRIDKKRAPNGGAYWCSGPFYCHRTPRTENDLFNKGYKR